MSREEMIISALVDLVNAKVLSAAVMAENHKENIQRLETKVAECEAKVTSLENILDTYDSKSNDISLVKENIKFTEKELIRLAKVQLNISPSDFEELFGEDQGNSLFKMFVKNSRNLLSFMFTNIDTRERYRLLKMINKYLNV